MLHSQKENKKALRLSGKPYVGHRGILKSAKSIGPPCECKLQCYDTVGDKVIQHNFKEFYDLCSYEDKIKYLSKLIEEDTDSASQRIRRRFKYYLRYGEESYSICKRAFMSVFSITRKHIEIVVVKINSGKLDDLRGKSQPLKIANATKLMRNLLACNLDTFVGKDYHIDIELLYSALAKMEADRNVTKNLVRKVFYRLYGTTDSRVVKKLVEREKENRNTNENQTKATDDEDIQSFKKQIAWYKVKDEKPDTPEKIEENEVMLADHTEQYCMKADKLDNLFEEKVENDNFSKVSKTKRNKFDSPNKDNDTVSMIHSDQHSAETVIVEASTIKKSKHKRRLSFSDTELKPNDFDSLEKRVDDSPRKVKKHRNFGESSVSKIEKNMSDRKKKVNDEVRRVIVEHSPRKKKKQTNEVDGNVKIFGDNTEQATFTFDGSNAKSEQRKVSEIIMDDLCDDVRERNVLVYSTRKKKKHKKRDSGHIVDNIETILFNQADGTNVKIGGDDARPKKRKNLNNKVVIDVLEDEKGVTDHFPRKKKKYKTSNNMAILLDHSPKFEMKNEEADAESEHRKHQMVIREIDIYSPKKKKKHKKRDSGHEVDNIETILFNQAEETNVKIGGDDARPERKKRKNLNDSVVIDVLENEECVTDHFPRKKKKYKTSNNMAILLDHSPKFEMKNEEADAESEHRKHQMVIRELGDEIGVYDCLSPKKKKKHKKGDNITILFNQTDKAKKKADGNEMKSKLKECFDNDEVKEIYIHSPKKKKKKHKISDNVTILCNQTEKNKMKADGNEMKLKLNDRFNNPIDKNELNNEVWEINVDHSSRKKKKHKKSESDVDNNGTILWGDVSKPEQKEAISVNEQIVINELHDESSVYNHLSRKKKKKHKTRETIDDIDIKVKVSWEELDSVKKRRKKKKHKNVKD